jgi:hypothetical protein
VMGMGRDLRVVVAGDPDHERIKLPGR